MPKMRAYLPSYELIQPQDFNHALNLISQGARPFAGGTDLMVQLESGNLKHKKFVNLWNLKELKEIEIKTDSVVIGALTTYSEIRQHPELQKHFPNLVAAAKETGSIAIQNRGTIGGNIANSSPAADTPPALLCYDAQIELCSVAGSRWVAYETFHTGYKTSLKKPEEIIRRIKLPVPAASMLHAYRKVGTRKAQAITKVGIAATFVVESKQLIDLRIAFSSVAPKPLRCFNTEKVLRGKILDGQLIDKAQASLLAEITPIDDVRSTLKYRSQVAQNLLSSVLHSLI
jgi:CO/xanthine dehydrogenase FAD-binding subunit